MRVFRPLDMLHPSVFFICMYIVFLVLSCILYVTVTDYFLFSISDRTLLVIFLYLFTFFIFSFAITPALFFYKAKRISVITNDLSEGRIIFGSVVLFSGSLIIHVYYFASIGEIPLFHENPGMFRVTAKQGFGGWLLLATGMLNALAIVGSQVTGGKRYVVMFMVLSSVIISALTGFRGPAASILLLYLLGSYFTSSYYLVNNGLKFKHLILASGFLFALSLAAMFRETGTIESGSWYHMLWTVSVNVYNLELIIEHFQDQPLYGETFLWDVAMLIPGAESKFTGVKLVELIGLDFNGEGMTVTAPGEGYANGSLFGVFLHASMLGVLSEFLYAWHIRGGRSSSILLLILYSFTISKVAVAGFFPPVIFTLAPTLIFLIPILRYSKRYDL